MKKVTFLILSILLVVVLTSLKTENLNGKKSSSELCVITKVVLNKMSSLNENGSTWDMGSGPDPYFIIKSQDKQIFKSGVLVDLDVSTLPASYTNKLPFTLPYLNQKYTIEWYESENGTLLKGDKYIVGYSFNPKDYLHQSSLTFGRNENFSFTFYLEWE